MADPASNIVPFPDSSGIGPSGESRGEAGGIGSQSLVTVISDGTSVEINPDNSVVISMPAVHTKRYDQNDRFGDNLADQLDDATRSQLADEVIEGVEADILTRTDLIDQYEKGIELLGTRIEDVSTPSAGGRSISRVGHPLLMESMIKFHAGAEAEMLPAEGPAKIMTIGSVTPEEEQLAADFQADFNYYLTDIATEFYPDTSRMLMHEAYCGNAYKKIFRDPMRERPVSESVSMLDLIVSEDATDLDSAQRVTHQIQMTRAQLRRMQIAGLYSDIDLGWAMPQQTPGQATMKQNEGLSSMGSRPQDMPYQLWETDLDVDIAQYAILGKWERRAPDGLPLAYKVTVNRETRQVLGVWRNWQDGDRFFRKTNMYVRYGLVPSLGFHHWGFLQILGNHTRALRAIWRLLIDAGMFSNFPGGMKLKGARTATNEISPAPGEWVDIDAPAGSDLSKMLMPLPYKGVDAVFIELSKMIEEGAARLGGTVMIETGEGRINVPVGTVMSMIEQQTQVMAGVHKRNHRSQREELRKLRALFAENPADLWRLSRDPARQWQVAEEFMDLNLVPASDPNIPAQTHRIMQAWALAQIAAMNPQMYDLREVNSRLLRTIRIASPDALLLSPEQLAQNQKDQMQQMMLQKGRGGAASDPSKMAAVQQRGQIEAIRAKDKQQEQAMDGQQQAAERDAAARRAALESADRAGDRASRERVAQMREETERLRLEGELHQHGVEQANEMAQHGTEQSNDMARHHVEQTNQMTQHSNDLATKPVTAFDVPV